MDQDSRCLEEIRKVILHYNNRRNGIFNIPRKSLVSLVRDLKGGKFETIIYIGNYDLIIYIAREISFKK